MIILHKILFPFLIAQFVCLNQPSLRKQHIDISHNRLCQKGIAMPDLDGKTYKSAKSQLGKLGIKIGAVIIPYVSDKGKMDKMTIYRQYPAAKDSNGLQVFVKRGQMVDLWLADTSLLIDTLPKPGRVGVRKSN
jgi:hypothetical protein